MSWTLFLDDLREPSYVTQRVEVASSMTVARSSQEAIALIEEQGIPDHIYFDHDLGGDDTAMALINWLIEFDMDCDVLGQAFTYSVHSANPVGKENIQGKLGQYLRYKFQGH